MTQFFGMQYLRSGVVLEPYPVSLHTSTQYPAGIIIVSETHTVVLEWKHTISCHAHQMDYFVAMWALSREPCDRRQRQRAS